VYSFFFIVSALLTQSGAGVVSHPPLLRVND